jgi:hypothetical protein
MLRDSEREKLQDCLMLIESARNILSGLASETVPHVTAIEQCFRDADQTITQLLRAA